MIKKTENKKKVVGSGLWWRRSLSRQRAKENITGFTDPGHVKPLALQKYPEAFSFRSHSRDMVSSKLLLSAVNFFLLIRID